MPAPVAPIGHTADMLPFVVAEALRRARRHGHRARSRPGLPSWRLLGDEVRHLSTTVLLAPRAVAAMSGLVAAVGVLVALGPVYPGPVAPTGLRWLLAATVAGSALGLARTAPPRWRDVRRAMRRARVGLAVVLTAASVSVLKVGLHEVTPGPVLPATVRWAVVTVVVVAAVAIAAGRDRTPGS